MNKLYIMVGVAGSGKSTYCKNHMTDGDIYISRDEIRYSMLKDDEPYFAHEKEVYREFIRQINEAMETGKDIWIDQTSLDRAARGKLLKQLCPNTYQKIVL